MAHVAHDRCEWLDVIPDLNELDGDLGLPVWVHSDQDTGVVIERLGGGVWVQKEAAEEYRSLGGVWAGARGLSPDLRQPSAVGWALCHIRQHGGVVAAAALPPGLIVRWLRGATTDNDRLALARALREVVDG